MLALGGLACSAPHAATPVEPAAAIPLASGPLPEHAAAPAFVGALERPAALLAVFEALERLESGRADGDVRIVELGDSHVAADWETGPLRRQLQARFGDGGRGFVPIGRPWKAWSQEGVLTGVSGEWSTKMNRPAARQPTADGRFGLAGFALESRQPGARAWTEVLAASSTAELAYLEQPGGGSFDVVVDGARVAHVSTRADARRSAFRELTLPDGATQHHLEVRVTGDGAIRILGVALDRSDRNGLVLDALGINGARVAMPLSWDETTWAEDLRHRRPALVIVAYGTNDAVDPETSIDAFEAGLTEELARIARAVPSASCLVLGPPDRLKAPRLSAIISSERHAAETGHCAFFDRAASMGGAGAIARWGQPDHVHLTREGYARDATAFVHAFLEAYDLWRKSK